MTTSHRLAPALAAALFTLAACGDTPGDDLVDGRIAQPDAAVDAAPADAVDAAPDAAVDAAPDAPDPTMIDTDRDGVVDASDCAPRDPTRRRIVATYLDADRDHHGTGDPVDTCIGDDAPDGRALVVGDCAPGVITAWQELPYAFRDADKDGRYVADEGTVCSGLALPPFHLAANPGTEADCAPDDEHLWEMRTAYADGDDDHVGIEPAIPLCQGDAALPRYWALVDGDCEPADRDRWRLLPYTFRDFDGDSATVPERNEVCSGLALPTGYQTVAQGLDCAPRDPALFRTVTLYPDIDHDGVGAGDGAEACIGRALPPETSLSNTDCAPGVLERFQMLAFAHHDGDGDGRTAPAPAGSTVCAGAVLVPPHYAVPIGNDCDDGDKTLFTWQVLYHDGDGDGVGAPPSALTCIGDALPAEMTIGGYDVDDGDGTVIEDEEADDELFDLLFF